MATLLDPERAFANISDDLLTTLAQGRVCIIDAPAGAATASLTLLCALAELRCRQAIPFLDLDVTIYAADVEPDALNQAVELHQQLSKPLSAVGIESRLVTRVWDASDVEQTNELMDVVRADAAQIDEFLVVAANFSGTASARDSSTAKDRLSRFSPSFEHIQARLSSSVGTFLWIEPASKASDSFFRGLKTSIRRLFPTDNVQKARKHRYAWWDTFRRQGWPCRVAVQRYVRD